LSLLRGDRQPAPDRSLHIPQSDLSSTTWLVNRAVVAGAVALSIRRRRHRGA
jgi:hypothetical protein